MLIPLAVLALGSIVAGLPFKEIFAGHGVEGFFRELLTFAKGNTVLENMHEVPLQIGILPTVMMVVGFVVAWQFYIRRPDIPVELARQHEVLYKFLLNKWYFDEIYDAIIVEPTKRLGRLLWKGGDGWLIDGFGRRRLRPGARRDPQRGAAADRLPLPLRLRHAHRRRRLHHLVYVRGAASMSMNPKSGNRFSDKFMRRKRA